MYMQIRGVVLRVAEYGETDVLLTILTQKYGKITAKARAVRRKNSPLTASCQLLVYAEFTVFEYRGQYSINEAHVIELFQNLRKDLGKLSLATYFAQVAELMSQEDYPTPELQSLLLNCMYALAEMDEPQDKVKAVFELRSACLSGYTPDLFGCFQCGSALVVRFDLSAGRLECDTCRGGDSSGIRLPIRTSMLEAMRYICCCSAKKLFSFQLPREAMKELQGLTEGYLTTQLEHSFSALNYYKSIIHGVSMKL